MSDASWVETFLAFNPAWIVHDDGDIIVVRKPAGIATQARDPAIPDDFIARLSDHLERVTKAKPYLGVHQRLDADTSGLMLLARRRAANASLAAQFEGRTVEKTYIAAVTGWKSGRRESLKHFLSKGDDGRMIADERRRSGGALAITHVEPIRTAGPRTLVRCAIETGRTHQIRAQLAAFGAPVAGDRLYGGAIAPRLMLHANELALDHPITGARTRFRDEPPPAFERWMEHGGLVDGTSSAALDEAIRGAIDSRWGFLRAHAATDSSARVEAFRLLDAEGDGIPGVCVEVIGEFAVVSTFDGRVVDESVALDAVARLPFRGVYLKRRPRDASRILDEDRRARTPATAVRGESAPSEFPVIERGRKHLVALGDGFSTGLFLDQRDARSLVARESVNRDVLNLFAYTCSFSVAAAVGGARSTMSVDVSRGALARGAASLAANALSREPGADQFLVEDVFEALDRFAREERRFDLVVVDPPTSATTPKHSFRSGDDWIDLASRVLRCVARPGFVLASSNDERMTNSAFRRLWHEALRQTGRSSTQMKDLAPPFDVRAPVGEEPRTKSLWISIR